MLTVWQPPTCCQGPSMQVGGRAQRLQRQMLLQGASPPCLRGGARAVGEANRPKLSPLSWHSCSPLAPDAVDNDREPGEWYRAGA